VLEVNTQRLRPSQALETLSAHCGQGKEESKKSATAHSAHSHYHDAKMRGHLSLVNKRRLDHGYYWGT
jgi:hypothetical protein